MKTNLELYRGAMDGNRWLQETPRRERSFFVTNRQTLYHNIYITITIITIMIRVTQSYLRLLHSLLANLGEGIAAVGEFGSQAVPQTRRVADFGNALVKFSWST